MEHYERLIRSKTEEDLKTIVPSRFVCLELLVSRHHLRIGVLDSPYHHHNRRQPPQIAALIVPYKREREWVFSTESGHLQLILSFPSLSRLILFGNSPTTGGDGVSMSNYSYFIDDEYKEMQVPYMEALQRCVSRLSVALSPPECVKGTDFSMPIVEYVDNLVASVVLETCAGISVGEVLVEDIEVESDSDWYYETGLNIEFRRRLRFKRMPNLVQTEVRIVPIEGSDSAGVRIGGRVGFKVDTSVLVHSYLNPMVAGISLIGGYIGDRIESGFRPKALCLGIGGGALLSFLATELGFDVFGVEADEEVLRIAKKYFGLEDGGIQVRIGDAIGFLKELADERGGGGGSDDASAFKTKFDVIAIDLDSSDPKTGVSAPPLEAIEREILLAVRSVLTDSGILVVNVVPLDELFYDSLKDKFRKVFPELYEIDVGNKENYVIIAKISHLSRDSDTFLHKLRTVIPKICLNSIRKI